MKRFKCISLFLVLVLLLTCSISMAAVWSSSNEWLKKDGNNFFGIGYWNTGNSYSPMASYLYYNVLHVSHPNDLTTDINSKVIICGHRYVEGMLKNGNANTALSGISYSNYDSYIDYDRMNTLKDNYSSPTFTNFLDNCIGDIVDEMSNHTIQDYIICMQDEPDRMFGSWCMYPEIIGSYKGKIQAYSHYPNANENKIATLGFGPVSGNEYWSEVTHNIIPSGAPPLGVPPYSDYYYRNHMASGGNYYDNTRYTVAAYGDYVNLFMLNSYSVFNADVAEAGKTVNAMRDGISSGNKPIWLWFNAVDMDDLTSYKRVRCQAYTAMTRKCTGVMLYGLGASGTNKDYADDLAEELYTYSHIYKTGIVNAGTVNAYTNYQCTTVEKSYGVYWALYSYGGFNYLLIANTDTGTIYVDDDDIVSFDLPGNYLMMTGHQVCLYKAGPILQFSKAALGDEDEMFNLLALDENLEEKIVDETTDEAQPEAFSISVSPNPFNPVSTITYQLPESQYVTIDIFNMSGQKVESLVNQTMSPGVHSVQFDGSGLASGVYLYHFTAGDYTKNGKMTLSK